jgi:hypothetical protein
MQYQPRSAPGPNEAVCFLELSARLVDDYGAVVSAAQHVRDRQAGRLHHKSRIGNPQRNFADWANSERGGKL